MSKLKGLAIMTIATMEGKKGEAWSLRTPFTSYEVLGWQYYGILHVLMQEGLELFIDNMKN